MNDHRVEAIAPPLGISAAEETLDEVSQPLDEQAQALGTEAAQIFGPENPDIVYEYFPHPNNPEQLLRADRSLTTGQLDRYQIYPVDPQSLEVTGPPIFNEGSATEADDAFEFKVKRNKKGEMVVRYKGGAGAMDDHDVHMVSHVRTIIDRRPELIPQLGIPSVPSVSRVALHGFIEAEEAEDDYLDEGGSSYVNAEVLPDPRIPYIDRSAPEPRTRRSSMRKNVPTVDDPYPTLPHIGTPRESMHSDQEAAPSTGKSIAGSIGQLASRTRELDWSRIDKRKLASILASFMFFAGGVEVADNTVHWIGGALHGKPSAWWQPMRPVDDIARRL